MSKLLLIFSISLLAFFNLLAQTTNTCDESSTEFTIKLGSQKFNNFSELNNDFSKKGIGQVSESYLLYDISFRKYFSNSIILGVSFSTNLLASDYRKGDSSSSKFGYLAGSIDLGYELLNKSRYSLYPKFSLGINTNSIEIKKYRKDEINWDELYYSNQIVSNEIRQTDLFINLAMVFNYIIDAGLENYNIPIGIELGGNYNLLTIDNSYLSTMSGTGIKVNNFPELYRSSLYALFTIGLRSR